MRRLLALILLPLASLTVAPHARAQATDPVARILSARRTIQAGADGGGPDSLLAARASLALAAQLAAGSPAAAPSPETAGWAAYYGALADYRLSSAYWQSDPARAKQHADAGLAALRLLERDRALSPALRSEAFALFSALAGNRVGLDPGFATTLGPEVRASINAALALAPDNPRVVLFDAAALLTTPPEWGGDAARAQERLAEAARLFETPDARPEGDLRPQWGHDDVYGWMGMGHLMAGRTAEARAALEAGLALNPHSGFIRGHLMPWLEGLEARGGGR